MKRNNDDDADENENNARGDNDFFLVEEYKADERITGRALVFSRKGIDLRKSPLAKCQNIHSLPHPTLPKMLELLLPNVGTFNDLSGRGTSTKRNKQLLHRCKTAALRGQRASASLRYLQTCHT